MPNVNFDIITGPNFEERIHQEAKLGKKHDREWFDKF